MNMETRKPKLTAPVARSIVGNQVDFLAELSEETLIGVTASTPFYIPLPPGVVPFFPNVICAYAGDSDE